MHSFFKKLRARFSLKDQAHFSKRLAFLTGAGVPLLDSLIILKNQNRSKSKTVVYERLVSDVSSGQYLSTSLRKSRSIFGELSIHIIKVGEVSGILSQNLNYLAEELKKKDELKRKIQSALIYPIFITTATIGITALLTAYIFPKLLPIFQSLHVTLPFSTRALIFVSNFIRHFGLYSLAVGAGVFIASSILVRRSESFRFYLHFFLLKIPVANTMIKSYSMANFTRTLGLLLKSGVKITDALSITADSASNLVYKKALKEFSKEVESGEKISSCMSKSPNLFPDVSIQMIAIGETSGNLGDTLMYLSTLHEGEVDDGTRNLASTLEPILMVGMGLVVGFVAVSIITPIYQITQNLKP
ncbi:MAG: type II secretion system F family protein [Candidatus Taylorbacteria bacterium]